MIRHDDEANQSSGTCYTLYLEFLGGLVPLLKGKRTSKIRPEFVIFDPQIDGRLYVYVYSVVNNSFGASFRCFLVLYVFVGFHEYNYEKLFCVEPLD